MHRLFGSRIVGRTSVFTLDRAPLVLLHFLERHELLARELRRTFERRRAAVVPDALELRLTVGRAKRRRLLTHCRRLHHPHDRQRD